jgi:hypothetical protein
MRARSAINSIWPAALGCGNQGRENVVLDALRLNDAWFASFPRGTEKFQISSRVDFAFDDYMRG